MARHRCPGTLCETCSQRLSELLSPAAGVDTPSPSLYALWGLLSPFPGNRGPGEPNSSAKPGPRSPADDEALSLTDPRTDPYRALNDATTALDGPAYRSFAFMCGFLGSLVDEIAVLPWAGDFLERLEKVYPRIRQAAGVKAPARIATCDVCRAGLYTNGSPIVVCQECGTTYDATKAVFNG